jgi:hypothetical protein
VSRTHTIWGDDMTLSRGSTRGRPWRRAGALVAGLSLLLSGCYTQMARDHRAESPTTRPWFCNAVGDGTPIGGHGNGNHVHEIYQGMTKGMLGWAECQHLANQFDALLGAVEGMETRGAAEAAGYRELAEYITGLGTHHARFSFGGRPPPDDGGEDTPPPDDGGETDPSPEEGDPPGDDDSSFFGDPTFEVSQPEFLIYGGVEPEAPLVGVAYAFPGSSDPPEAFAGSNDWWHLHRKICIGENRDILAGAEEIPDEECAALGGRQINLGPGIWLLHVWLIPDYELRLDAFASGHPCLGETGPLPWEDPCWETVRRDPSEGLPPGTGHDDHGDDGTTTTMPPETTTTTAPPTITTAPATTTTTAPGTTTTTTMDHGDHGDHGA